MITGYCFRALQGPGRWELWVDEIESAPPIPKVRSTPILHVVSDMVWYPRLQ